MAYFRRTVLVRTRSRYLDLARSLDLAHEIYPALELALDLAHALDFAHPTEINVERSLEVALDLAFTLDPTVAVNYALYYSWTISDVNVWVPGMQAERVKYLNDFSLLINLCKDLGAIDTAEALSSLRFPDKNAETIERQAFVASFRRVLEEQQGFLPSGVLSEQEYNRMDDYFYANELLVRCLDLAYVTNRQAILDNLLRPPSPPPSD